MENIKIFLPRQLVQEKSVQQILWDLVNHKAYSQYDIKPTDDGVTLELIKS